MLPTTLKNRLMTNLWRRTDRASSTQPQSTSAEYFSVVGGRVILINLIGEVTVTMGATDINWIFNPTTGVDLIICSATACDSDVVGQLYSLPVLLGAPMNVDGSAVELGYLGYVVGIGALELDTDASVVGETKWSALWLPFDDGAVVVAA